MIFIEILPALRLNTKGFRFDTTKRNKSIAIVPLRDKDNFKVVEE